MSKIEVNKEEFLDKYADYVNKINSIGSELTNDCDFGVIKNSSEVVNAFVLDYPASIDDLLPGDILVVDDGNDNQHAMLYAGNGEIIQAHSNYNSESGGNGGGRFDDWGVWHPGEEEIDIQDYTDRYNNSEGLWRSNVSSQYFHVYRYVGLE